MPNPIFNLIKASLKQFNPAAFETELKVQEATREEYYLVKSKLTQEEKILKIQGQECKIAEVHLTVFTDLKAEEGNSRAAYHLTMDMKSDKATFVTRSYFDVFGRYLYTNCKTKQDDCKDERKDDKLVEVSQNDIGRLVHSNQLVMQFQTAIQRTYSVRETLALNKADALNSTLDAKSAVLTMNSRTPGYKEQLKDYKAVLDEYTAHLESWSQYSFKPDTGLLNHLHRLKILVAEKFRKAEFKEQPMVESVPNGARIAKATGTLNAIPEEKTVIRTRVRSIEVKAWELVRKYEDICKKLELVGDAAVYHQAIFEQRKLIKAATLEFRSLLHEVDARSISEQTWQSLLKMISIFKHEDLQVAFDHNHHAAFAFMLNHSPHRLNNGKDLLIRAYERADIKSFTALLQAKVYCDDSDEKTGHTLLMRACQDKRAEEMVALLQAGAWADRKSLRNYSALGYLICDDRRKPDSELVKAFLSNSTHFNVDLLQGLQGLGGTVLMFACQKNWASLAILLLERGADPTFARMTDRMSTLDVCAAKGFNQLLEILLDKSQHPLAESYPGALKVAQHFKQRQCEQLLLKRMETHSLDLQTTYCKLPLGTPIEDLLKYVRSEPANSERRMLSYAGSYGHRSSPLHENENVSRAPVTIRFVPPEEKIEHQSAAKKPG